MMAAGLWRGRRQKVEKAHPWAAAAELPRGTGAVGHQRARLAGRARGKALPDPHDRRCHQRTDSALCTARLDRREHAAMELPGTAWPAGGVLHRQSGFVPHGAQGGSRPEAIAPGRAKAAAANPDRAGLCRNWGSSGSGAHPPLAKGRVERSFGTAQDRLVRGLRVAGARTLAEANRYLEQEFLLWWNQHLVVTPATPVDAHRELGSGHELAASLSEVVTRQVDNDYTIRLDGKTYRIVSKAMPAGLRGGQCGWSGGWMGAWRCAFAIATGCWRNARPWSIRQPWFGARPNHRPNRVARPRRRAQP